MLMKKLAGGAALCALALAATGAYAQEITGGIAGTVTENGKAVVGAAVKVTNSSTGQSATTESGGDGFYTVRNLPPGGPYTVVVTAPDKVSDTETVSSVPIGAPVELDVALGATAAEVTVTASPVVKNLSVATGPRTVITSRDIQELPSFARDLHDLVRLNPFVTIDEANSNSMIVAGANNHFNTIYLDGVRQSDDFGLNNNGYPTQRNPFSLGIVQSLNFEVAPYDVQYGNFEGGIVNVVTKSGTNQFHGSVQYEYDSSSMSGKFIGPDAIYAGVRGLQPPGAAPRKVTTVFQDEDSQVTIGGPLYPDKLFFFFGYDKFQGAGSSSFVPSDAPGANPIAGVTTSDVSTIQNIFRTMYHYDPLNYGGSAPLLNTDYFAKLDWYINDKHHFWFSFQDTEGASYNTPDAIVASKQLNLASSDYVFAQDLTAYTADLTSNWTNNLATEVEFTYRDVESPTKNVGAPYANVLISNLPGGGQIDLGPDISRQANNLGVKDWQARFRAHYTLGDHVITGGYEWEKLSEFDLFVQDATGAYTFSTGCGPGAAVGGANNVFDNLKAGVACKFLYQNAFDNNPNTAANTAFNYTNTLYLEDEWHPLTNLTVTGGIRAEMYSSPSKPLLNPRFVTQYRFANNLTVDGEYIVMPRVGFNWRPDPSLTVTGGFGLFSGGNPGVYTYDSFTNPGNLLGSRTYTCSTLNCATQSTALTGAGTSALVNFNGATIPTDVQTDITNSAKLGAGIANALSPNFKPPSQWKFSLSAVQNVNFNDYAGTSWGKYASWLGDGWRFHADFLYEKTQNAVFWQDIWATQYQLTGAQATALGIAGNGTAPDGRPLFNPNRYICGAPSPNQPAGASPVCNAFGIPVFANGAPTGVANTVRTSGSDILLNETNQGDGLVWAIGAEKYFGGGLDIDYTYTHQNVRDVNPATSSVANSNYINNITADPNHPALSTSNYQILYENRLAITYVHKWLGDNNTTIRLFLVNRAGLPFSYAFCPTASGACASPSVSANFDQLFGQASSATMHQLLYVPKADASGNVTATSDPRVTYNTATFNVTAFNAFLHSSGLIKYAGQIAPRNAFRSSDVNTADIHFGQEVPALFPHGAKGEVYFDIVNLLNLINRNWGIDNQVGFPYVFAPVTARNCQFSGVVLDKAAMPTCLAGQGNFYQYDSFRPQVTSSGANQFSTIQTLANPPIPTWVIKFGIRYKF